MTNLPGDDQEVVFSLEQMEAAGHEVIDSFREADLMSIQGRGLFDPEGNILRRIGEAKLRSERTPMVMFWGPSPRENTEVTGTDFQTMDALALVADQNNIDLTFILADEHGKFNATHLEHDGNGIYSEGETDNSVVHRFRENLTNIAEAAQERGISTILMSDIFEQLGLDASEMKDLDKIDDGSGLIARESISRDMSSNMKRRLKSGANNFSQNILGRRLGRGAQKEKGYQYARLRMQERDHMLPRLKEVQNGNDSITNDQDPILIVVGDDMYHPLLGEGIYINARGYVEQDDEIVPGAISDVPWGLK